MLGRNIDLEMGGHWFGQVVGADLRLKTYRTIFARPDKKGMLRVNSRLRLHVPDARGDPPGVLILLDPDPPAVAKRDSADVEVDCVQG